jgi:hypothetical protein
LTLRLRFRLPKPAVPTRLNRLRQQLHLDSGTVEEVRTEDLEPIRRLLRQLVKTSRVVGVPTRTEARAAIACAFDEDDPAWRGAVVQFVLAAPNIGWRHLWILWGVVGGESEALAAELAARLSARVAARPQFERRIASWLPRSEKAMHEALLEPDLPVRRYCEAQTVPLDAVAERCQLALDSRVGRGAVAELVRSGSDAWWRLMSDEAVRKWVEGLGPELVAAVVERQVLTLCGEARSVADLPEPEVRGTLVRWVLATLGDPADHPGRWSHVKSARVAEILELMLVADEFGKILARFKAKAEDDRARYWERYAASLRDARYHEVRGVAVCMMVLGSRLVVEFGATGNACYFYAAPNIALRRLDLRDFRIESFKYARGWRFDTKLSHSYHWWGNFDRYLLGVGVTASAESERLRGSPGPSVRLESQSSTADHGGPAPSKMGATDSIVLQCDGCWARNRIRPPRISSTICGRCKRALVEPIESSVDPCASCGHARVGRCSIPGPGGLHARRRSICFSCGYLWGG